MIGNLSRLVIRWVRKSKYRTQFSDLAFEVCQDLLVAFVCFDLAHRTGLQLSRHFVQVSLLVTLQRIFEFCTQTSLSTLSISVSNGKLGFLALEDKR